MNRKLTEKRISEFKEELSKLTTTIQALEKETGTLDYSNPSQAVKRLEEIQSSLYAKRSAVTALQAQLRLEEKNLKEIIQEEMNVKVSVLREKEQEEMVKVIQEMNSMETLFESLWNVQNEIRLSGGKAFPEPHLRDLQCSLELCQKYMKSVFPQYYGLPSRRERKEKELKDRQERRERLSVGA